VDVLGADSEYTDPDKDSVKSDVFTNALQITNQVKIANTAISQLTNSGDKADPSKATPLIG
jgi:hypothetical protein